MLTPPRVGAPLEVRNTVVAVRSPTQTPGTGTQCTTYMRVDTHVQSNLAGNSDLWASLKPERQLLMLW